MALQVYKEKKHVSRELEDGTPCMYCHGTETKVVRFMGRGLGQGGKKTLVCLTCASFENDLVDVGKVNIYERMKERHHAMAALEGSMPDLTSKKLAELLGLSTRQVTEIRRSIPYRRMVKRCREKIETELLVDRIKEIKEVRADEKLSRARLLAIMEDEDNPKRLQFSSAKELLGYSVKKRQAMNDLGQSADKQNGPTQLTQINIEIQHMDPKEKIDYLMRMAAGGEIAAKKR